ncbi:hypothetical protein D3C79_1116850 [compost metagenome]
MFAVQEPEQDHDALGTVGSQENRFQFLVAAAVDAHPVAGFECCGLYGCLVELLLQLLDEFVGDRNR